MKQTKNKLSGTTPAAATEGRPPRIILSGGGTGGHIFPAISIANEIKNRYPGAEILFVGAENRMEMEKIPAAGYPITGLPIAGFDRKNPFKNIPVLFKLYKSLSLAKRTLKTFRPDVVIGVGGYASGPTLRAAAKKGIPTLIQEQNSYAGITNKLLAKKAVKICVAYEGMEQFFPPDKIVLTGNPVRRDLACSAEKREEACRHFNLNPQKKTILILGGSLGARTINESVQNSLDIIRNSSVQFIWQTGKQYYRKITAQITPPENLCITEFIARMDLAFSVADLIISRAGAGSISEFSLLGKAVILTPSPNVAEDHQTKNAQALVRKKAAVMIPDKEAIEKLIPQSLQTIQNDSLLNELRTNILQTALPNAAGKIVDEIDKILGLSPFAPCPSPKRQTIPQAIYFIGAGGIGMSALIRYFLSKGKNVAGYDRTESDLTRQLNDEGASIHYEDNPALIPPAYKDKNATLVVYTPAVPADHAEWTYFRQNGFEIIKRAQLLGEITRTSRAICVAGTHGKTTTSSMIAHLLKQSTVDCNAFLGGILKNYDSNLLLSGKSDWTVVEADEYDRSFHRLSPAIAVITSVAPDHLDIYGTAEAYREAFVHFTSLVRENGILLIESQVDVVPQTAENVKIYRYAGALSPSQPAEKIDFYAQNVRMGNGEIRFDCVAPGTIIRDVQLGVPVEINIVNAVAALAVAWLNGVSEKEMRQSMATFQGAKRRFDFHVKTDDFVLIDDYAHHPEELEASITSIKKLYPGKKLTVVFQPHLYSRTNDFYREFARSLSLADEVILIPIYPAREEPIEGVSSQMILDRVTSPVKKLFSKEELLQQLKKEEIEILLIAGAGDIELLVEPVKKKLYA
jgi:UDP-N-acetylmuramate--alanine ligase